MRKPVNHRMTRKARQALEIAYQVSGENPIWTRKTHGAVRDAYAYIARVGYVWDSDAQMWQYDKVLEFARATLPFSVTAVPQDIDNVIYVLTEALKDAHYKVTITGELASPNAALVRTVLLVIEP